MIFSYSVMQFKTNILIKHTNNIYQNLDFLLILKTYEIVWFNL